MQTMRIGSGQTTPGATAWTQYGASGLTVEIDTSQGDFTQTPIYVAAIGGSSNHWSLTGGSAVYNATAKAFRIYVKTSDNTAITPENANANKWHINWIGVQLFAGEGTRGT